MSDATGESWMRRLDELPGAPRFCDLAALWAAHGRDPRHLPYSLRVLAENVARLSFLKTGSA